MTILKKISQKLLAVLVLAGAVGSANAIVMSGSFNANGYDVLTFNFASASTVDFQFLGGWNDAIMSLFNSDGQHVISNDDTYSSLNPRITSNLVAGKYSLLVSYCCTLAGALDSATPTNTDGYNIGRYWVDGAVNIADAQLYLDQSNGGGAAFSAYQLYVTEWEIGAEVPEPGSVALFGAAIGALALARRRMHRRA